MRGETTVLTVAVILTACTQQESFHKPKTRADDHRAAANHSPDLTGWPIVDGKGNQVGIVSTRLENEGVLVTVDTRGLPTGLHGVHIHATPKCDGPQFESAGGHWNFTKRKHGHNNPEGYHAGDLGNLNVDQNGSGMSQFLVRKGEWDPGLTGGLSIVIHAKPDDEKTDPSGDSGDRIACGLMYLRHD